MEASTVQAKGLPRACVKAAMLLAAINALAILAAPCTVGFSWTRTAAHSLLDRQVRNAHMRVKSQAAPTASGGAQIRPEILYCQEKTYSIRQYLCVMYLRRE